MLSLENTPEHATHEFGGDGWDSGGSKLLALRWSPLPRRICEEHEARMLNAGYCILPLKVAINYEGSCVEAVEGNLASRKKTLICGRV